MAQVLGRGAGLMLVYTFRFGVTILGSSPSLQLCFETFPKTPSLSRNSQKSGWFPHYRDGNLGAFGEMLPF